MLSANTIINDALSLIGYVAFGEAPEAEAAQLGARTLQGMLADFSISGLINPKLRTATITMPFEESSTGTYMTVGSADVTNDIPFDIMDLIDVKLNLGPIVYNLEQISYEEYMALSLKTTPAVPRYFAFDYQEPQGKIYLYMSAMSGFTATVIYRPRLTQIVNNQSLIDLDLYWQQALVYNLATRLYPHLPGPAGLDQNIIYFAKKSIEHIKDRNHKMNKHKAIPGYKSNNKYTDSFWTSPLSGDMW